MKMTQKDKVLLILLGLIVVVALVVVMPGFGVMACNDKIKESATASSEVDEELTAALTELREMGVEAALADIEGTGVCGFCVWRRRLES